MKANELMTGDWVGVEYYANGVAINGVIKAEKKTRLCKVVRIDDYLVTVDRLDGKIQDCLVTDLIPIPLAEEVLEKNGWIYNDENSKFAWNCWDGNGILLRQQENIFRLMVVSDYDDQDVNETPYTIQYVHELQHLMKLRKTTKEIIL